MHRRAIPLLIAAALVSVLSAVPVASHALVPSRFVVTVDDTSVWSALERAGVHVLARYDVLDAGVVEAAASAVSWVRAVPGVRAVSADAQLHTQGDNSGSNGPSVLPSASLPGKVSSLTGSGATVAVIDTGISDTPALDRASGRLIDAVDTSGEDSFVDGFGHGTAMATIVAGDDAPGSDGSAIGLAPEAEVLNVKVADASGTTSLSRVIKGIAWLVRNRDDSGVDVALLALAADRPDAGYSPDPLTYAVDKLRESGITVVAAAGNRSGILGDPAFDPSIIAVGALDTTVNPPAVASFSGSGTVDGYARPDLLAPGVRMLTLLPSGSVLAKTYPAARQSSGLWRGSGTSHASAVVAGLAADYVAASGVRSPDAVRAALRLGAASSGGRLLATGRLPRNLRAATNSSGDSTTWSASTWASSSWSSSSWSASSWSSSSWSSSSWSSTSWSSSSWSSSSWSSSSWSSSSWSSSSWSSSSWSGRWGE